MKANELKAKTMEELKQEIKELLRAQFSLRMQLSTQQTTKTHELRKVRRDIARARTVMHEQNLKAGN
ncbi:MAG: 50S ribosomal protein L29 [Hydrogenophilales bacterium CG17_big_fil_post_rev_8_21_14_2_50_63_12]|nr:MAG: 50S ribosomal protein L29 [Hydrogenophilales bacterium CG17_big_fil_post_rev_8_21_14_2_50_63_12]PIX95912.1 MAG: 50S ribosomal protein L29 [Hydrogenophilales bacterium CG_4_10_14_3_um_filter_63_21]PJB02189.1 MAG: 50S ribosomal protein L29 [Hydrogenophilales bacterium CG_4_9_14_3_um_filter_63_34]